VSPFKEDPLCFCYSILDGDLRILWEVVVTYDQLMKLVPEVVSARCSSMAIVNREEATSGPFLHLFELWFDDVEDN